MMLEMKFLFGIFSFIIICVIIEAEEYCGGYGVHFVHVTPDNKPAKVTKYQERMVNLIKHHMKTGFPKFKLPILDPLVMGNIKKTFIKEKLDVCASVLNLTVTGLSNFSIHEIFVCLGNYTIKLKLAFDKLFITTERYELSAIIKELAPIHGDGKATIEANKVEVTVVVNLCFPSEGAIRIEDVEVDLDFGDAHFNLENFLGGGDVGDHINGFLGSVAKPAFEKMKPKLLRTAKDFILTEGNKKLSNVNFEKSFSH